MIRLEHCVSVVPLYESLPPPTLMRTWCVSVLLGLIDMTIRPEVNLLTVGTPEQWMKNMLFVPLIPFPTSCASLPMSLENFVVQVPFSGPRISCVYPWFFPVAGSNTPWKATAPPPAVSTVWLDCVCEHKGYL